MGATYTRQSSYTDGDTITAAHTNDEFNQLLAAFAASTGHTHDGTTAEGGPITKLLGNTLTFGAGTSGTDITITFDGETSDGVLKWMEDEDYFEFSDDILVASTEKLQFRDTAIYINSSTDGQLDLVADTEIQIAATTVDINGNVDISGTLTIGSAGISEAELEILDGATVTTTEINILDGDTSATSTTVADADRVVFNDAGTMKQVAVTDLAAYFDDEITAMPNLTSVGTLTTLTVDNVIINGTTIGHTDDTDLITLADGIATVAGEVSVTTLDIGGTNVTSTAAELNILDGVTATTSEINLMDGDTTATSTTLAAADRLIVNDAGTMKQVALSDFETFFESALDTTSNITTVGALDSGSITSGFGTIDTGSSTITTTGLITGGSLDIDDVLINGTTIGHTDDTDLITLADGVVTVAGEISVTTLDIGGTNVTSTAAELNILDGVTSTATEINILDGDTGASSVTVADADRVVLNDGGTMKQVAVTDLSAYFDDEITAMPNLVTTAATTVGALDSGSITSGFGTIDTGSSAITTTGVITGGTLEATADTSSGDNAAIGYTAAEGLILTGQGSTSDITLKNDADATVAFVPTGTDDLRLPDDAQLQLGDSGDLRIYHNGSTSFIEDVGTGNFLITTNGNNIQLMKDQSEQMLVAKPDDAVELYYDNVKKFETTSTGVDTTGNVTATGTVSGADALSHRNMVINGAMQVAQRSATSTGVGADGISGYHNVDRWRIDINATSAGRVTMAQTAVTDLAGFANSMKISCTTADTSIAAGEALIFNQRVEGQNIQRLTASSTSTQAFTLSFYAKSNASRAIASEINFSNGTNKQISKVHTIGTSWARYTMTVPAASSTQIDDDNSHELSINFWLHAGSTFTGGTINDDALDSITNANRAAGIGSIFASTDNFFEITGVQLELGSVATPYEHRTFADDLAACQRYYVQLLKSDSTKELVISGGQSGATNFNAFLPYSMRAAPTITWPASSGVRGEGTTVNISSIAGTMDTNNYVHANATITSGLTANTASFLYAFQGSTNLDAEL